MQSNLAFSISERIRISLAGNLAFKTGMTILNHMSYYGEEFEKKVFGTDFLKKIRDNGLNERDITHAITCKKLISKSYFRQINDESISLYFRDI